MRFAIVRSAVGAAGGHVPEGPEIRRAADRIAKVLVGERVEDAWFAFDDLKHWESELEGQTVTAIDTRGKAMLTRFDNDLTIYSHNQLYGRWYVMRGDRLARVGPHILDSQLKPSDVVTRLGEKRFRNRGLGALYLDQGYLAGNGNYLRSEILFVSGEHPAAKPSELDAAAAKNLAKATLSISRRAYRHRGVTVTPELARKLKAQGQSYSRYRYWVFGRDGRPCRNCGETIERMDVASRRLYYCPACQRRRS